MPIEVSIAIVTLLAVVVIMAGETMLSAYNERLLRARSAISHESDLREARMWAYPVSFVAMAVEGAIAGPAPPRVLAAGLLVFGVSKALKLWAISTLGVRWTYRVLVLPGEPPIAHGPYALLRHPNYVAILGEMAGMAMIVWAPLTGALAIVGYGAWLRRKGAVEDRALGRQ
jgi:methyltransferase